jgi:MFS family permease
MRALLTILSPVMGATFFVMGADAAITTMIAVLIATSGGAQSEVALIAACYSAGFLAGCFLSPGQIQRVGLIRAFAASAAILTIAIVAIDLFYSTWLWAFLRLTMGLSMAAILASADSWINHKTPSDKRGKVIAVYGIVAGSASLVGQVVFLAADATADGFALIFAIGANIAVVLVAAAPSDAPVLQATPRQRLISFASTSVTANVAAFASGFMISAVVAITPFYQTTHGLSENLVAATLMALFLGRLLFMWPVGWLSDRFSRRVVLLGLSLGIVSIALLFLMIGKGEARVLGGGEGALTQGVGFFLVILFGGAIYPVYSVSSSLAFDRAEGKSLVDVSTTILAIHTLGAITGPFTVSLIGTVVGDATLLLAVIIASGVILATVLLRVWVGEPLERHTTTVGPTSVSSVEMVQAAAEVVEEQSEEENMPRGWK